MGPSGICVVRLEIPPAWFTPPQVKKRPHEGTLPLVDVYYSVIPVEGTGKECPSIVNEPWRGQSANTGPLGSLGLGLGGQWSPLVDGGLQDMLKAGSVAMSIGPVSARGQRLQLDENVEVLVPPSPVRLGKTVAFGIYMKTDSNMEQFTLRWEHKYYYQTYWLQFQLIDCSVLFLSHFTFRFPTASLCYHLRSILSSASVLSHLSTPPPPEVDGCHLCVLSVFQEPVMQITTS